ncbi:ISL3 family transposase [Gemmata sp. JC673]|uniref:ISL3 family transposase n=1 Tax=Gemmata algarum TaxID=2975278 RepID=A0ABU5F6I3_9BACT|nr:ISL3 family transposase [Gemmata algarum]MDY3563193.1 ISL3 family transposase [Gemmata algarum]
MIVDHDHGCVLDVLERREKGTVLGYLRRQKERGVLSHVEEVTTDMWDAYVEAAREAFGESVAITIDRFHVMKNFQDGLTAARRELQRGLSAAAKTRLKGSRWWVTNPENLREEDREPFARLRQEFPMLGALWDQREGLRAIFEDRSITTVEQGRERLEGWMREVRKLGLSSLDKFCKTLTNWMGRIANYFGNRNSNGRTEGFNHGLRSILWRAWGMVNFKNFRLRVLDRFGRAKT